MARSPARKTPKAAAPSAAAATPDAEAAGTAPAAAEAAGADADESTGAEGSHSTTDSTETEANATDTTGAAADDAAARGSVLQPAASLEPAPVDPDAPQRYVVCSPLEHDLVLYGIGAELSLTEAQAAPLLGHTVALKNT